MTAADALLQFRSRGLDFASDGKELRLLSNRDPTDREDAWIAAHIHELIRELTAVRLDFETVSMLDPTKVGTDVYAAHPATQILLLAWCVGVGDVQIWQPCQAMPSALRNAIANGSILVSHGSFDRIIWEQKVVPLGWPAVPLEQWSDTSARARAYRVPASLEKAAERLALRHHKSGEGKALIRRATAAAQGKGPPLDIDELLAFDEYAAQDVATLRELDRRLPELSERERSVWLLNERMNARGLPIDLDTVHRLHEILIDEDARLTHQMRKLCGFRPTQTVKLLAWLQEHAVNPPANLKAETLGTWLRDDIFGGVAQDVIETRQQFANTSGAKLGKMLASTSADGRARGCLVWHGAHTGRWSGRGFQPQNLPRPPEGVDLIATLAALVHDAPLPDGMHVKAGIAGCLRALVRAPAGQRLVVVDFAQIESRVLCWLAGQEDMLDLYRRGDDPYIATAKALGSNSRQFGKLLVLAAGFGGGSGMLLAKAPSYGVHLSPEEAEDAIIAWRAANRNIEVFWNEVYGTMRHVVGERVGFSRQIYCLTMSHDPDDALRIRLPSGRALIYHQPRIEQGEHDWRFGAVVYQQPLGRDWVEKTAWRGLITENIVQAIAYDVMAYAMLRMEEVGIELVGTVHDEAIALTPIANADAVLTDMTQIMSEPPPWAPDLPLAAQGYHNERYVKP